MFIGFISYYDKLVYYVKDNQDWMSGVTGFHFMFFKLYVVIGIVNEGEATDEEII